MPVSVELKEEVLLTKTATKERPQLRLLDAVLGLAALAVRGIVGTVPVPTIGRPVALLSRGLHVRLRGADFGRSQAAHGAAIDLKRAHIRVPTLW